jgi:hypothetical protein
MVDHSEERLGMSDNLVELDQHWFMVHGSWDSAVKV